MELFVSLHSFWTVLVAILFIGIVWWTWSGARDQEFHDAANLPFEQDDLDLRAEPTTEEKENGRT